MASYLFYLSILLIISGSIVLNFYKLASSLFLIFSVSILFYSNWIVGLIFFLVFLGIGFISNTKLKVPLDSYIVVTSYVLNPLIIAFYFADAFYLKIDFFQKVNDTLLKNPALSLLTIIAAIIIVVVIKLNDLANRSARRVRGIRYSKVKERFKEMNDQKGEEGEKLVEKILTKHNKVHLNGVLIENKNQSAEFDHIIFQSDQKILVIETKNWSGKIDARKRGVWSIMHNGKFYERYSPLEQNRNKVENLKHLLSNIRKRFGYDFFFEIEGYVVLTAGNKFTGRKPKNVLNLREFEKIVRQKGRVGEDVKRVFSMIKKLDVSSDEKAMKRHINRYRRFKG